MTRNERQREILQTLNGADPSFGSVEAERGVVNKYINHPGNVGTSFDTRYRFWNRGRQLFGFEDVATDWSQESGTVSAETSDVFRGAEAMRMQATSNNARADNTLSSAIDITDKSFNIAVKVVTAQDAGSDINPTFIVRFRDSAVNFKRYEQNLKTSVSSWQKIDLRYDSTDTGFDPTDVQEVLIQTGGYDDIDIIVDSLHSVQQPNQGYVIVSVDDGAENDVDFWNVMGEYGIPATFYVTGGRIGTDTFFPRMTKSELDVLYSEGAVIASQGYEHDTWGTVSASEFRDDVRRNKEWLIENGYRNGAGLFAWGASATADEAIDILHDYHVMSSTADSQPRPTGNFYTTNMFLQYRTQFDEDAASLADAKTAITKAADENGVAHVYGHTYNNKSDETDWRDLASHIDSTDIQPVTALDYYRAQFLPP